MIILSKDDGVICKPSESIMVFKQCVFFSVMVLKFQCLGGNLCDCALCVSMSVCLSVCLSIHIFSKNNTTTFKSGPNGRRHNLTTCE